MSLLPVCLLPCKLPSEVPVMSGSLPGPHPHAQLHCNAGGGADLIDFLACTCTFLQSMAVPLTACLLRFETTEALADPLLACYWSLWECGGGIVADGRLLDLLRRVYCFGPTLMKLDLRQESTRHTEAVDAVTQHLDLGMYSSWPLDARLTWLNQELNSRRPLVPSNMPMTSDVREVMATLRVAAQLGTTCLGAYVISMARDASDILAVELLKREACLTVRPSLQSCLPARFYHLVCRPFCSLPHVPCLLLMPCQA